MIKLVFIGKVKDRSFAKIFQEYLERIGRYTKVEVIEIKDEPIRKNTEHLARQKEGQRILEKVKGDFVIVLDMHGKHISSEEFALVIKKNEVMRKIAFVVGGPTGLADTVKRRADYILSFSSMTMGNQLMRLVIMEQIYRAYSIIHNRPYHK